VQIHFEMSSIVEIFGYYWNLGHKRLKENNGCRDGKDLREWMEERNSLALHEKLLIDAFEQVAKITKLTMTIKTEKEL